MASACRTSIVLLAYQQAPTVGAAAESCLVQHGGPYEIVFSDDASKDGTYEELQRVASAYHGPHRVSVRRNPRNLGIGEHYNALVRATEGDLIVTAAGDDVSLPDRVRHLEQAWQRSGRKADLIASHVVDLDHDGRVHGVIRVDDLARWSGIDDWVRGRPYIIGAGHAFTRRMAERFGPLAAGIAYEDQVMVFRAIVAGGAVTVDAPLVRYRRGGTSGKPVFADIAHMHSWSNRQSRRLLAEWDQLLADAGTAGCFEQVNRVLGLPRVRERYLLEMREARDMQARWALFRQARELPRAWRFRKLLHSTWPRATFHVKRALTLLHRD